MTDLFKEGIAFTLTTGHWIYLSSWLKGFDWTILFLWWITWAKKTSKKSHQILRLLGSPSQILPTKIGSVYLSPGKKVYTFGSCLGLWRGYETARFMYKTHVRWHWEQNRWSACVLNKSIVEHSRFNFHEVILNKVWVPRFLYSIVCMWIACMIGDLSTFSCTSRLSYINENCWLILAYASVCRLNGDQIARGALNCRSTMLWRYRLSLRQLNIQ